MVENKPRALLFGSSGKLGSAILSTPQSTLDICAPTHSECDIAKEKQVITTIARYRPNLVINAAALVGTKECEQNRNLAWKTNVVGSLNISRVCNGEGIRHVFTSSAAIFDGQKGNYSETDFPSPTFYYAITKVAAEQSVSAVSNYAIIRLDFFPLIKLKYPQVFIDHFTSKISVSDAAEKIIRISTSPFCGILNIGQERDSLYNILKPYFPEIVPIKINESSLPNFPRDISLNLSLWRSTFEENLKAK